MTFLKYFNKHRSKEFEILLNTFVILKVTQPLLHNV